MRALIVLATMLISVTANAQSISFSPISHQAWGRVPDMGSISVEYKGFGLHYFGVYKSHHFGEAIDNFIQVDGGYSQSSVAVTYIPVDIKEVFRAGALYAFNNFPTNHSSKFNFWLDVGYKIGDVRFSYVHISNGFGLFNTVNPGLDRIRISVDL